MPCIGGTAVDSLAQRRKRDQRVPGMLGVIKGRTISIIDDDASLRAAIQDLLESLGFAAYGFESAEEFLSSPQLGATSCLITDVQMPGMKGHELQQWLRARGDRTPIIFITSYPTKNIRECVAAGGALAFLEKPFEAKALLRLLRDVLSEDDESTVK